MRTNDRGKRDPFDEEVNGQIIGGDFIVWQLRYHNRAQGIKGYSDTEDEAVTEGHVALKALKTELGSAFVLIYPGEDWSVSLL